MKTDRIADAAQDRQRATSTRAQAHRDGFRALRGPLLSIIDQAIVSGTSFATAVIVGRTVSQEHLGFYYLTLTLTVAMAGLQEAAIAGPYTIFAARRKGRDSAEYAGSMWMHHGILTAGGMLLLLGVIGILTVAGGSRNTILSASVLLFAGPLLLLREGIRRYSFARLHVSTAIAVDATVATLQLAGLLSLWYFGLLSVPSLFFVIGGACFVACVGWFLFEPRTARIVRHRVANDWKENWPFAKWSLTSFLIGDSLPLIMPWLISLAAGAAATGVFGACATLVGVANVLVLGTGNFLTPKAAQAYASGGVPPLRRILLIIAALFFVVFGICCVAVLLTGDRLPILVYGDSFAGTGTILAVLALNVLIGSLGMIARSGLLVLGLSRTNFMSDVVWFVTTLGAALYLIASQGAFGAALATLIGTIATVLFRSTTLVLAMRAIERSDESRCKNDVSSSPLLFSHPALPILETSEAI